jgi:hypothetical protein
MKGSVLRITRRLAAVTISVAAAAGLVLGEAAPALADTQQAYEIASVAIPSGNSCEAILLSAQLSASGPAYVSAVTENTGAKTCTSWIQRSTNKGKTWTNLAKHAIPHTGPGAFVKTGEFYDGPGNLARPCAQYGTGKAVCGTAMTLRRSAAKSRGGGLPLSYERSGTSATTSTNQCFGGIGSTTAAKRSTSRVDALLGNAATALNKAGTACTAVLQVSANGGKSWKTVSGTHVLPAPANQVVFGFTATYPDGTGHLARVCITLAGKRHCSTGW